MALNPKPPLLSNVNASVTIGPPSWGKGDWEARWNNRAAIRRLASQMSFTQGSLTVGNSYEFQVRRVGETAWSEVLKVVATKEESAIIEAPLEVGDAKPKPAPTPTPIDTAKPLTNTIVVEVAGKSTTITGVTKVTVIEGNSQVIITPVL